MEEHTVTSEAVPSAGMRRIRGHVNTAGILQIVFGSFWLLGGLIIAFALGFASQFVDDPNISRILGIVGTPLVITMVLFGGVMIAGGIGLLYFKTWARVLTLVMAAIGLLNVPLGTLKGVYIIWALMQSETITMFETGCSGRELKI